jgi:pimeloyl-ACP methyl ester carboxylesterase
VRLRVEPLDGLVDEPPSIAVQGAPAGAPLRLELTTTDAARHRWRFAATYGAGTDGALDLARDEPAEALHEGTDPSAPFWAMEFASEDAAPVAFAAPADALEYDLSLSCGGERETLTLVRRWRAPDVEARSVSGEGFAGKLLLPAGGATSAVLVVPGSTGAAVMEPLAALLASHGHGARVAAYMQEEELPSALEEIPVEVVGRALRAVRSETGAARVGVVAVSVGTQGALAALALGEAEADCAVAIAPSGVIWQALPPNGGRPPPTAAWSHGGEPLPWLPIHGERILPEVLKHALLDRFSRHPRPSALHMLPAFEPSLADGEDVERAAIPVERIACPLLLVCGEDDQMWPGALMAKGIVQRRRAAGTGKRDVLLSFPDAGHFVRPPVTPTTVPWNDALVSGGSAAGNAHAQAEAWTALLGFLDVHLQRGEG